MSPRRDGPEIRAAFEAVAPLPDDAWGAVAERLAVRRVSAGGFLLRAGDRCDYLGVLVAGALRTYTVGRDGDEQTAWLTTAGMVTTEVLSFYEREPTVEFVEAVSEAEVWALGHADLDALARRHPPVERWARRAAERVLTDLKRHWLSQTHDAAPERYARLVRERPAFLGAFALKHVASFLGMAPSTLSRVRADLAGAAGGAST